MPHFFINSNQKNDNNITICDSENYRHIAKSLRMKINENLLLIDELQTQYETIITDISKSEITCKIIKEYQSKRYLKFNLYLAQSPLRSDAQITIVEKSTELGISGIYPVCTDNCALNKNIINNKIEKWQRVMLEASKQCERANIPTCYNLTTFEDLLKLGFDKIIVMAERSEDLTFKKYLDTNKINKGENILIIIGPEGGFSQKEFDYFKANNLPLISLGDLILKAETAVITALGNLIYEYNR